VIQTVGGYIAPGFISALSSAGSGFTPRTIEKIVGV